MTGESILVVEDEAFVALQLRELLEKNGYRVSGTRHTGKTPLRSWRKIPPISSAWISG